LATNRSAATPCFTSHDFAAFARRIAELDSDVVLLTIVGVAADLERHFRPTPQQHYYFFENGLVGGPDVCA
jgi:hypothetical protein